ncbi:RDD family protein [Streptomyces sp. RY43-2]|uniref:RDD family protein n=1 Tax=Streptomyces macrolidinus TaxID=2952607 RepID=A0ABT0Z646_9ACTN|nr:RDD family protein [Streptomyces macrolidinus]MCN9239241.1 RDD family protein [Streptomyces macrolidinus]
MSTEPPPPGPEGYPDPDPSRRQQPPPGGWPPHGGAPPPGGEPPYGEPPPGREPPYGAPPPGGQPPYGAPPPGSGGPYSGGPYGGGPYGGGPYSGGPYGDRSPLAGMPPLADSLKRVIARVIDMILVGIVVWLLSLAFHQTNYNVSYDQIQASRSIGQSVIAAILYTAYDTYLISKNGQTVGKKLMNLRVANLADGATPSLQTSLIRAAVLWLPFAFCCAIVWTIICGGWSFFDRPYKQGLHDKAARTVVVSTA